MKVLIFDTKAELGAESARTGAEAIRNAIRENGAANVIVATGASQFETLAHLSKEPGIDWTKVSLFHLDEYAGMPETHPASFRKYIKERFVAGLPVRLASENYVKGDSADLEAECRRLGDLIRKHPVDVAFVGIGENGHLAFNDPPADFNIEDPYITVELDEKCRRQQLGEGWFRSIADVPKKAISMSISHIMKSKKIICSVPDQRKAEAVRKTLEGEISNMVPASVLRRHPDCTMFLDRPAASLLSNKTSGET